MPALASALDVCPFRGIALSNTAHPFNHCRQGLFSGGRAQTSNGIANEGGRGVGGMEEEGGGGEEGGRKRGSCEEYKVFW